jgi:hypothetical protein
MTMAMVAVGVGAAAVVGGATNAVMGANAARSAAEKQQNAANAAEGELQSGYNTASGLLAPTENLGFGAEDILAQLYGINSPTGSGTPGTGQAGGMGANGPNNGPTSIPGSAGTAGASGTGTPNTNFSSFYNSPGFQYAIQQAGQSTNALASAGGNLFSSGTLNSLNKNVQGVASGQYNNYVSQLLSMAGMGAGAASTNAGLATSTAANEANVTTGAGAAQASGVTGAAGAIAGGVNTAINGLTSAAGMAGGFGGAGAPNASGVAGATGIGGSIPTANPGYTLSYDANGNIVGQQPIMAGGTTPGAGVNV